MALLAGSQYSCEQLDQPTALVTFLGLLDKALGD
jgi:hypothetical protein